MTFRVRLEDYCRDGLWGWLPIVSGDRGVGVIEGVVQASPFMAGGLALPL
jgi:hypothetical protein